MHARLATTAIIAVLGAHTTARAEESSVWWELENQLPTLRREEIRPEYLEGKLAACARLGELHATETTVAAKRVAAAREACMLVATTYVKRCIDAPGDAWCKPPPAKLAASLAALAPLSKAELAVIDRIPDPFWVALARPRRDLPAQDIDTVVGECIAASQRLAAAAPAKRFREAGRDLCVAAATAFARDCLGDVPANRCLANWDRWEDARDAGRALAALSPEQAAVFDRIIGSAELADHRLEGKFQAIVNALDQKQIDRCQAIDQMRQLLGPPTKEVTERVQKGSKDRLEARALSRLGTYVYMANQMYLGAKAALEIGVEDSEPAQARTTVHDLECVKDFADASTLLDKATAKVTAVDAYQAKEAACLATPSCKAKRVAGQICSAIKARQQIQKDIHTEWRYGAQSGVVDVKRLASDKNALETLDDEIAAAKKTYAELAKRAFSTASCR